MQICALLYTLMRPANTCCSPTVNFGLPWLGRFSAMLSPRGGGGGGGYLKKIDGVPCTSEKGFLKGPGQVLFSRFSWPILSHLSSSGISTIRASALECWCTCFHLEVSFLGCEVPAGIVLVPLHNHCARHLLVPIPRGKFNSSPLNKLQHFSPRSKRLRTSSSEHQALALA